MGKNYVTDLAVETLRRARLPHTQIESVDPDAIPEGEGHTFDLNALMAYTPSFYFFVLVVRFSDWNVCLMSRRSKDKTLVS